MGCNHLLYPADRFQYITNDKLYPEPVDLRIPVQNSDSPDYVHAWLFRSENPVKKGVVIHFHGNGQNLTTHFMFFNWILDHGYDYLIFDYRGYGKSSGENANQKNTVEDGVAVLKYVKNKLNPNFVVTVGQSLGTNVLTRTLQQLNEPDTAVYLPDVAVFDSAFLSYQKAGSSVLSQKWFLYPLKPFAYLFLSDEWAASRNVQKNPNIPALFFHGQKDPVIQLQLGLDAYNQWIGPKHFIEEKEAGHTASFGDRRFLKNRKILINFLEKHQNPQ